MLERRIDPRAHDLPPAQRGDLLKQEKAEETRWEEVNKRGRRRRIEREYDRPQLREVLCGGCHLPQTKECICG